MRRLAWLSFCCLLQQCAHAQVPRQDAKVPVVTKKAGSPAPTPAAKARFSDDIAAVFREVQASGLAGAKGEFESTAQFQARVASWKVKAGERRYVFVVAKGGENYTFTYEFEYDADAERMRLIFTNMSINEDEIELQTIDRILGTYVGSNAFGVKKTITRVMATTYHAKLSLFSPFDLYRKDKYGINEPAEFTWTMDPAAARAGKGSLRIAIVGTVPSPETTEETVRGEPTINAPIELLSYRRTLPFSLEELRIVNVRTGMTIASFPRPTANHLGAAASAAPLAVEPTNTSSDPSLPSVSIAKHDDPFEKIRPVTNGDSSGGGVDSANQPGAGVYVIGGGVSAPIPIFKPEPEYSEEARKAKIQGTVMLAIVVGSDGKAKNIEVVRSLGMGLD